MGFLDTILGMFGIGQPTIAVSIDKNNLGLGGLVTATITMTGGNRDLPLTALVATLKAERDLPNNGGKTWDTLAEEQVYFGEQIIQSGDVVRATITLQVPKDCTPSSGKVLHKVVASADVPGWDPDESIQVTITSEEDPMAAEDTSRYHVLPEERSFRNSSVRGDFRVIPGSDGVVLAWHKSGLVLRNADGSERWRNGFGRTAVFADGVVIATNGKTVGWFDAATGEEQRQVDVGDWVNNIVALPDGGVALNCTEKILVLNPEGEVANTITSFGGERDEVYCGSLCADPDGTIIAIDSNERLMVRLDPASGAVTHSQKLSVHPSDVYRVGDTVVVDSSNGVVLATSELAKSDDFDLPGRKGVRFLGQSEHSSTHFKPNARLSPNGQRVLLNDQSGLLWLLDRKGKPVRNWTREQLPYVEDANWLDDANFVAITNDGRSHGVSAETGAVGWTQQDA